MRQHNDFHNARLGIVCCDEVFPFFSTQSRHTTKQTFPKKKIAKAKVMFPLLWGEWKLKNVLEVLLAERWLNLEKFTEMKNLRRLRFHIPNDLMLMKVEIQPQPQSGVSMLA